MNKRYWIVCDEYGDEWEQEFDNKADLGRYASELLDKGYNILTTNETTIYMYLD